MIENGKEVFTLKLVGGPHSGTRFAKEGDDYGFIVEWPLPDELIDDGGHYKKVSESQINEKVDHPNLVRGAEYKWVLDA